MIVFFSILYHPTENCIDNIVRAKKLGYMTVVYLNYVSHDFLSKLKNTGAIILGNNVNVGLGLAFYEFEQYMNLQGYNYFVYFDQDTIVKEEAWYSILNTYISEYRKNNVGLVYYSNVIDVESKIVINSGSLFSMDVLNKIGFHDNSFFVEGIDYEFCFRLNVNNLIISKIECEGIDHVSLQDGFQKRFLCWTLPLRVYKRQRMKDFNFSHLRLLFLSLKKWKFQFFMFFFKSILRQNFLEKLSKFYNN
jgi:hypothetical protein